MLAFAIDMDRLRQTALSLFSGLWRGIFAVIALIVFVFLVLVLIALVRLLLARLALKRDLAHKHALATAPDGRPAPPYSRGLCSDCGRADDVVYFLQDGKPLCRKCYQNRFQPSETAPQE
jgi:hypothetical protein